MIRGVTKNTNGLIHYIFGPAALVPLEQLSTWIIGSCHWKRNTWLLSCRNRKFGKMRTYRPCRGSRLAERFVVTLLVIVFNWLSIIIMIRYIFLYLALLFFFFFSMSLRVYPAQENEGSRQKSKITPGSIHKRRQHKQTINQQNQRWAFRQHAVSRCLAKQKYMPASCLPWSLYQARRMSAWRESVTFLREMTLDPVATELHASAHHDLFRKHLTLSSVIRGLLHGVQY